MSGENTEVDRSIIERLSDPLTHIIRNSIDHGIETPADRIAAGKHEEGTIRLAAEHRGGRIVIEVARRRRRHQSERVLKKAREKGLVSADAALTRRRDQQPDLPAGLLDRRRRSPTFPAAASAWTSCAATSRTSAAASRSSPSAARGMTIQLALPLTLAVMDGMVIQVGRETYVMPMSAIVECLRPPRADIHNLIGTRGMLQAARRTRAARPSRRPARRRLDATRCPTSGVVIITEAGEGIALRPAWSTNCCGHQQVVIKSIEESYGAVPGIAGATILGNGRVAFILDIEKLSDIAVSPDAPIAGSGNAELGRRRTEVKCNAASRL